MSGIVSILVVLLLGFIAFKVLMGLVRIGVIILLVGGLVLAYSQGVFG